MPGYIQRVLNPDWYHGHNSKAPYFEGWYFKFINADEDQKYAFIPGIFWNRDAAKSHAFLQVLDGTTGDAAYHSFPVEAFRAKRDSFDVWLGNNHFSSSQISLDLDDDVGNYHGEITFTESTPFPVSLKYPGVMGPFGWLFPFMECNHGVVSVAHRLNGSLIINQHEINFDNGIGYTEKDWGTSFPEAYVWQQSNHFATAGTSLMASIAVIPNFGFKWVGLSVFFWHDGKLYRFASYTRAKVDRLVITDESVEWAIYDGKYYMEMASTRTTGGLLLGPERKDMLKRVNETLQSTIEVKLFQLENKQKHLIFHETGRNAGLEVVGNIQLLLQKLRARPLTLS